VVPANNKSRAQNREIRKVLLGLAERLQVDAELLALFVEVAALETEYAGHVGHVEIVATDFRQEHFLFEGFGALHQSA